MGISLLLLFTFGKVRLGYWSLLLAHITFCIPYVVVTVYSRMASFDKHIFEAAKELFAEFVPANKADIKSEFFIPIIADEFIKDPENSIKVIPTSAQWFGVTYKEDAPSVQESINKLVASGTYPGRLY